MVCPGSGSGYSTANAIDDKKNVEENVASTVILFVFVLIFPSLNKKPHPQNNPYE